MNIKSLPFLLGLIALTSVGLYSCGSDAPTDTDSQTPSELLDDAGEGINDAVDGAQEGLDNAVDGAGDALNNAVDGANDALNDAVDGASDAIDDATSETE
ncbi:MAG: hypothetical protein AAGE92_09305 [Cyanobacteria bacterium P01_G01_bin.4]